jgi:hypothetical protein
VLPGEIQSVDWLKDGSGFVASRMIPAPDWNAAEKLIPATEAAATRDMARAMPDLLKAALIATGGSLDDIEEKFFKPLGLKIVDNQLQAVFRCAWALHREKMLAAIAGLPNAKEVEAKLFDDTNGIPICEISLVSIRDGHASGEPRAIVRSLHQMVDPVISPRHPFVAFRTAEEALKVITLEGKSEEVVVENNVHSAVWSGDGLSIFHVVLRENGVGEIRKRAIATADGVLLAADKTKDETLAVATFHPLAAAPLHVLPDGRILFASIPITLPIRVNADSVPMDGRLFILDAAKTNAPLSEVAVKEGSLPADLNSFAVSPDGRFIAIVETETDVVAVFELATGKVEIIWPAHKGLKSRLIPAWRNNRELTFAAEGSAKRPELMIWEAGRQPRALSKDWPDEVVKGWLEGL